jgi:hypothetical protein
MPKPGVIDIRLSDLRQLFNSLDPAPFHEKDLDRDAEEYIAGSADEFSPGTPLELVIHLPTTQVGGATRSDVPRAVHNYFAYREEEQTRRIRFELRQGRAALAIGLAFLAICMVLRQIAGSLPYPPLQETFRESLLILGWVAMWRPLQIFLYDWWPLRHYAALYRKLARMPVHVLPF